MMIQNNKILSLLFVWMLVSVHHVQGSDARDFSSLLSFLTCGCMSSSSQDVYVPTSVQNQRNYVANSDGFSVPAQTDGCQNSSYSINMLAAVNRKNNQWGSTEYTNANLNYDDRNGQYQTQQEFNSGSTNYSMNTNYGYRKQQDYVAAQAGYSRYQDFNYYEGGRTEVIIIDGKQVIIIGENQDYYYDNCGQQYSRNNYNLNIDVPKFHAPTMPHAPNVHVPSTSNMVKKSEEGIRHVEKTMQHAWQQGDQALTSSNIAKNAHHVVNQVGSCVQKEIVKQEHKAEEQADRVSDQMEQQAIHMKHATQALHVKQEAEQTSRLRREAMEKEARLERIAAEKAAYLKREADEQLTRARREASILERQATEAEHEAARKLQHAFKKVEMPHVNVHHAANKVGKEIGNIFGGHHHKKHH